MRRHPSRMAWAPARLLGATVASLTAGFVLGPASAAFATDPSPSPGTSASPGASAGGNSNIGPATPGTAGCAIPDNLAQVTGMVNTDKGLALIQGHDDNPTAVKIAFLDANCKATTVTWTGSDPLDPEDLSLASDGSLVVADVG